MKAKPLLLKYGEGYFPCKPEEATHVELHMHGVFPDRIIPVTISQKKEKGKWFWNGDIEEPTLRPSILTRDKKNRCHSWVTNGKVQYLSDSSHEFAGKTLDLLKVED